MQVPLRYQGRSAVISELSRSRVALATNALREAAFFRGAIAQPVLLREAFGALYRVVTSDSKYRPRERPEFQAWLEEQDRKFLASRSIGPKEQKRFLELQTRLAALDAARDQRLKRFYDARRKYVDYVFTHKYELNYIFDPVITVHPDEILFEAFSRDESVYAKLGASFELFDQVDEFECGTTNIDFSARLHRELERMRSYRPARFDIGPSGFAAAVEGGEGVVEKKIDLPDSWVRGFHQVHGAMAMGLARIRLSPIDLFNLCRYLRRRKAKVSPRSLRYQLTPGQPTKVVIEPWGDVIEFSPLSIYEGLKPAEIRVWGRQRLLLAERLLPICRSVDLYLAGLGLPSLYVLDLGPIRFTLGLSGWTDNDWAKTHAGAPALGELSPITADQLTRVYDRLKSLRFADEEALAKSCGLSPETVRAAASRLCRSGRAIYDLAKRVYRHRELFPTPFSAKEAIQETHSPIADPQNPRELAAKLLFDRNQIFIIARRPVSDGFKLSGNAGHDGKRVRPLLHIGHDRRVLDGSCTCRFFTDHRLTLGPCEHILALRLAHLSRLEQEG